MMASFRGVRGDTLQYWTDETRHACFKLNKEGVNIFEQNKTSELIFTGSGHRISETATSKIEQTLLCLPK